MAGDDACTLKEIPIKNKDWLLHLNTPGSYLSSAIGAPFSELFSVGVLPESNYFEQRDTLEIYGSITLYDENNNTYQLYHRSSDDPQTLTPQNNLLSLGMPAECLVSTCWTHIFLSLADKTDNSVIVRKALSFDKLTDINQYNKVGTLSYNSVFVTYAAFPTAVMAILEITLIKTNDSAPTPLNLSGKITARCGNTYGSKYPGIVLLNRLSNQSFEAVSNVPILLPRDVVVVPAYSFLRINLHLCQLDLPQQQDIICQEDFLADSVYVRDTVSNDFVVRFKVVWCHPHQLWDETGQLFDLPKIFTELQLDDFSGKHFPRSLVEVYTVVIHHNTNRELEIFGTVAIRDSNSRFLLFDRDELNPVKYSGKEEIIPIEVKWRCLNMTEYLAMGVKLKDVKGEVLIEGEISWSSDNVKKPMSWYDERICSVIRGVNGYAEVFYIIFSEAVQAKLRILFKCNGYPDVTHRLSGSVVATHSNETYLTEHEKAYYQSVLYRGNSSSNLQLQSGCALPLSKSVVAVPIDAVLTVAIDLNASPLSPGLSQAHLKSDVSFNLGSDTRRIIEHNNCSIVVSLEWSDLDKLVYEEWDLNDTEKISKLQFTGV
ncbi:uncharacterized protein LOC141642623 [Silene latifolia]|uniref:uncharacterized protein LOC141642623 n=1 Tax=Silene latifolia TaxID=37657 RepID=UPI003D789CD2